jgi:hypothetical protein
MRFLKALTLGVLGICALTFGGEHYGDNCKGYCHEHREHHEYHHRYHHGGVKVYITDRSFFDLLCGTYGGSVEKFCSVECRGHHHHGLKGSVKESALFLSGVKKACRVLCALKAEGTNFEVDCSKVYALPGESETGSVFPGKIILWLEY